MFVFLLSVVSCALVLIRVGFYILCQCFMFLMSLCPVSLLSCVDNHILFFYVLCLMLHVLNVFVSCVIVGLELIIIVLFFMSCVTFLCF